MRKTPRPELAGAYLTREAPGGDRRALPPADLNREGLRRTFEVRSADREARTVELAFSSEAEVSRWFGIEVLDHSPDSIRLERLRGGAALLVNHDWNDQVGVVESADIGNDRRGRAVVRFGRSARAEEIFQDVVDGIRKLVSVGYRIHAAKLDETREGGVDVYRITDWEPFEISLVSVPADTSVGVGRSAEIPPEDRAAPCTDTAAVRQGAAAPQPLKDTFMHEKILRDAQGNLVRAQVDEAGAIVKVLETIERAGEAETRSLQRGSEAERARVRAITEMGERFKADDLARAAIKDGKSADEFRAALLEHMNQRGGRPLNEQAADANIGLTDAEARSYSFLNVVRALANPTDRGAQEAAAFEIEVSRAAARAAGKEAQGILIPTDVLGRALNTGKTTGAGNSGGYAIATELMSQSFVDMLRTRNTLMQLGFTMAGLVGNVDIPRQIAGAQGYWIGEDEDAGEGAPSLDQISLSPKTVAAYTDITRKLMQQSSVGAELLVRRDLAAALAATIDRAGYYGSGSANQPRGIVNYSGINAVAFAGATPTYGEIVAMETEIAADNADVASMQYVMNARMRGALKTTQKFAGTNGAPVWEAGNTVNGYGSQVTNQIATGDVVFGNFADLLIGLWGGLDLTVDPYSKSKSGGLRIVVFQDVDFAARRVESFCLGRKPA